MTDPSQLKAMPCRIAVVTNAGGSENEVSLRSADNVCVALMENFENVAIFSFDEGLEGALRTYKPDIVFPVAHGIGGESGVLQNLLASMRLPFVGSDAQSSATCWDKALANSCAAEWLSAGRVPSTNGCICAVPPSIALHRGDDIQAEIMALCERATSGSIVIKPACEGSSCGISFFITPLNPATSKSEVVASINGPVWKMRLDLISDCVEKTFAFDSAVIVQEAVSGTEITVGVLEDPTPRALPVVEVVTPKGTWYDYQHKYSVGASDHIIPARLPAEILILAEKVAVSLHHNFGCRDYSRSDFIVSQDSTNPDLARLWFLEINTLPGMTKTSLFPDAARAAGIQLPALSRKLVLDAWTRRRNLY